MDMWIDIDPVRLGIKRLGSNLFEISRDGFLLGTIKKDQEIWSASHSGHYWGTFKSWKTAVLFLARHPQGPKNFNSYVKYHGSFKVYSSTEIEGKYYFIVSESHIDVFRKAEKIDDFSLKRALKKCQGEIEEIESLSKKNVDNKLQKIIDDLSTQEWQEMQILLDQNLERAKC